MWQFAAFILGKTRHLLFNNMNILIACFKNVIARQSIEKVFEIVPENKPLIFEALIRKNISNWLNSLLVSFRSWRTDFCKGSSALVSVSVDHEDSPPIGSVRGVVLESQYLLEPCGIGRTRLTHISRVDLRCGCTSRVFKVLCLNRVCSR